MTSYQMATISGINQIVRQDPIDHLNCRKHQILAFVASRTNAADLLLYQALEPTFEIFRHCYIHGGYRWTYPDRYFSDDDLSALGVEVMRASVIGLDGFQELLDGFVARDAPVMFFAPRGHFDYWRSFMRSVETREDEYLDLHSFMVCGETAPRHDLLVVDDANNARKFTKFVVSWDLVEKGWSESPDKWFADLLALHAGGRHPNIHVLNERYHRASLNVFDDEFEIYDLIAESLTKEKSLYPETYRSPGINSLALLCGSRIFFRRFLSHTGHNSAVKDIYERNARTINVLLSKVARYHSGRSDVSLGEIRNGLRQLKLSEIRALDLLREDLCSTGTAVLKYDTDSAN